jgi:hypothetical protein
MLDSAAAPVFAAGKLTGRLPVRAAAVAGCAVQAGGCEGDDEGEHTSQQIRQSAARHVRGRCVERGPALSSRPLACYSGTPQEFLEREKRKQAEREAAKLAKAAASDKPAEVQA